MCRSFLLRITANDKSRFSSWHRLHHHLAVSSANAPLLTWIGLCPRWASHFQPQRQLWWCCWGTSRPTSTATDRSPATGWPAGRAGHRSEWFPSSLLPLTGGKRRLLLGVRLFCHSEICQIIFILNRTRHPLDKTGIALADARNTVKIET